MKVSPCMSCTRVRDPRACENKRCRAWRVWFVKKWNVMRLQPRLAMEKRAMVPEGVCIGGQCYAQPHRVRQYLATDPCGTCLCPRDLCAQPCRVKRSWEQARKDVLV